MDVAGRFKEISAISAMKEQIHLARSSDYIKQLEATRDAAFASLGSDTGTCASSTLTTVA